MREPIATPGGEKFHWVGGQWVEGDALRIAEQVSEFDPNLRVQYLEEAASIGDPPFRVVEMCRDGVDRTVLYAWSLDGQLLERLRAADSLNVDVLANIDAHNAKLEAEKVQRYKEEIQEATSLAQFVIDSHKDTVTVRDDGKLLVIRTDRPVEVRQ